MAYNNSYNPDALPAHAEPEQAAQILGSRTQGRAPSGPGGRPLPPPKGPTLGGHPVASTAAAAVAHGMASDPKHRLHSPPPPNYGYGPRPISQTRPLPSSRPPVSPVPVPVPRSNDPNDLFPLFRAANASNTGSLSEGELGSALVNGDYTTFDPATVRMMVRMFDKDGNGRVGFDEFVALWRFLAAWRELFDRFDEDLSSRISIQEFGNALVAFGYKLSQRFVAMIFNMYDRKGRLRSTHEAGQKEGLSFDLFVQACITLKRMTDVFKKYDDDRDGYITMSFEEFLTEVLSLQE